MNRLNRWISVTVVAVVSALSASMSGGALPAQAAPPTYVVDNTGTCKNSLPSLAAGVAAAGAGPARVLVCAGTYAEAFSIAGAHDILLEALDNVYVVPPAPAFSSVLMAVDHSTNITIRGFNFDGNASLDTGAIAVAYRETSGTITENRFDHWLAAGETRAVVALASAPLPLEISGNQFADYAGVAIDLYGEMEPVVTGNSLDSTTSFAIGIRSTGQTGGSISSNALTNVGFPIYNGTAGIILVASNKVVIANNRLLHFNTAIGVTTSCTSGYGLTADSNQVTGNRIFETSAPIYLGANTRGETCAVQANHNVITGNEMVDVAARGEYGILVQTMAASGSAHADFEVVKGNTIRHFNGPSPRVVASGAAASMPTGVFAPNTVLP